MSDWDEQRRMYAHTLYRQTMDLVARCQETHWTYAWLEKLNGDVHQLAGGAATWGFGPFSDVARELERTVVALLQRPVWDTADHNKMTHLLAALAAAARYLDQSPPTWPHAQPREQRQLSGLTIMLVEDSGDFAYAFQVALTLAGAAQVVCCATTVQAQQCLAPHKPHIDIVLIDHHLGRRLGGTLAAWMRQQEHLQTTWRISYSGATAEAIARTVEPQTYDHILPKVDLSTLITILSQLGQRVYHTAVCGEASSQSPSGG